MPFNKDQEIVIKKNIQLKKKKYIPDERQTRSTTIAKPFIEDANELLASTPAGLEIIKKSSQIISNLFIAKSGVAENAGNGLYIIATTSPIRIVKNQVITWFSGKVEFYDASSERQKSAQCYTIGLGNTKKNVAPVIISNPCDQTIMGWAHFANHSTNANCRLGYVKSSNGINGVFLESTKDTLIPPGYALEFVFDYGSSAQTIHHIDGACHYFPHIIPMSHFEEQDEALVEPDYLQIKQEQSEQTIKQQDLTSEFFDNLQSAQLAPTLKAALNYYSEKPGKILGDIRAEDISDIVDCMTEENQLDLFHMCMMVLFKPDKNMALLKSELIFYKKILDKLVFNEDDKAANGFTNGVVMGKKNKVNDVKKITDLAEKFLPKDRFCVIEQPEDAIFSKLFKRKELYYFIKTMPELDTTRWLLMFISPASSQDQNNKIIFIDPEGLVLDKVSKQWFSGLDISNTDIYFCHSWFKFRKDSKAPDYTYAICISIAKLLHEGHEVTLEEIDGLDLKIDTAGKKIFSKAGHYNFNYVLFNEESKYLSKLLVTYPETTSKLTFPDQEKYLSEFIKKQQDNASQASADKTTKDVVYKKPASPCFFSKEEPVAKKAATNIIDALETVLFFYIKELNVSGEEIKSIKNATPEQQDEIWALCNPEEVDELDFAILKDKINKIFPAATRHEDDTKTIRP